MKVLHLSYWSSNSVGRVVIPRIAGEMSSIGVESEIACGDTLLSWLRFRQLLRQFKPQVLHYQFTGSDHSFLGMQCVLSGVPFVVTLQGLDRDIAANPLKRNYLKWLLGRAKAVTAVSESQCSEVREICRGLDIQKIYNGAAKGTPPASGGEPRRPFIMSVSSLHPLKGLDLAALAFRDALQAGQDIDWVVCGYDGQSGHLQSWIKVLGIEDRVRLRGHLPFDEVSGLLARSLFLVHTARYEPFGMAVIEAMAMGKPVLATSVGGIPEYVRNGRNGFLVRWGDLEGLKDSMLRLLSDADLRADLGREAEKTAARFPWSNAAREYLQIYRSICRKTEEKNEAGKTEAGKEEILLAARN